MRRVPALALALLLTSLTLSASPAASSACPAGRLAWGVTLDTSEGWSPSSALSPDGETVYVLNSGSRSGGVGYTEIRSVDVATGAVSLFAALPNANWHRLAVSPDGHVIYVGGDESLLVRSFATDGSLAWEAQPTVGLYDIVLDLAVSADGSMIFVAGMAGEEGPWASKGILLALFANDGAQAWLHEWERYQADYISRVSPSPGGATVYAAASGGTLNEDGSLAMHDGEILALDAATGALRWTRELDDSRGRMTATAAGAVFVDDVSNTTLHVEAVEEGSGGTLWTFDASLPNAFVNVLAVSHGRVFISAQDAGVQWGDAHDLFALDEMAGSLLWAHPDLAHVFVGKPTPEGDLALVLVAESGQRALRALNGADGGLAWEHQPFGDGGTDAPTLEPTPSGVVVTHDKSGVRNGFRVQSGTAFAPCLHALGGPGRGEVSLAWTPREGEPIPDTIRIFAGLSLDGMTLHSDVPASAGAAILSGLGDGANVWVAIQAVRDGGEAPRSPAVSVIVPTLPAPPTGPAAVPGPFEGSVALSWSDVEADGDAAARVLVRRDGVTIADLPASARSFLDEDLEPRHAYAYDLLARNVIGDGRPTDAIIASAAAKPTPPQDVDASPGPGAFQITVSWDAPMDDGGHDLASYSVVVDDGGRLLPVGDTPAHQRSLVVDVTPGFEYEFRVFATNALGWSDPSDADCAHGAPWQDEITGDCLIPPAG